MSYQIKSTPFFRRLVSTSKKNGDLQKLKDEYERIKGFNEHGIEKKMRQVRLKRLYKKIEGLRENDTRKRRMAKLGMAKLKMSRTPDDEANIVKRNFRRASFTRMPFRQVRSESNLSDTDINTKTKIKGNNNTSTNTTGTHNSYSKGWAFCKRSKRRSYYEDEQLSKARVLRRVNYGNQISSWNMQRMLLNNLRKDVQAGMRETREKSRRFLHKPFQYMEREVKKERPKKKAAGNTVSRNSSFVTKQNRSKSENVTRSGTPIAICSPVPTAATSKTITAETVELKKETCSVEIQTIQTMEESNIGQIAENSGEHLYSCQSVDEDDSGHEQAKTHWNKVAKVVTSRIDPQKCIAIMETLEECHNNLEYQLRTISNVTDLPQSQIIVQQDVQLNLSENDDEDDDDYKMEKLICRNILYDVTPNVSSQDSQKNNDHQSEDDDDTEGALLVSTDTIYQDALSKHEMPSNMPPPAPPLPTHLQHDFKIKPLIRPLHQQQQQQYRERVDEFLRKCRAFTRHEVKKQLHEYSVQRLCDIFEHRQ